MAHELLTATVHHAGRTASALMVTITLACTACAPISREARTTLDPRTGTSITIADQPLVLARERRDLAAQARDYLTLVAAEVNVAGARRLVLCMHEWSTIDARTRGTASRLPVPLLVVADGRDIRLRPETSPPFDARDLPRELGRPEDAEVVTTFYAIEPEALRYLASAQHLSAALPDRSPALPFGVWRDGRRAQIRLLEAIGR
jgi:hypothetical protein